MAKFRKKPVVIEAVQITDEWFNGPHKDHVVGVLIDPMRKKCSVDTLEGVMNGCIGDWVITGVKGEKYFCKPDIFEATYESADKVVPKLIEERLEKFLNNYFKFHNVDISYKRNAGENYQDFVGNLAKAILKEVSNET